jgi:scyllo-inositol 2-dehydrogenase (NADP+)
MIRFLVIGAGRISLSHIPHLMQHKDIDLVGVIETSFLLRFIMKRLLRIKVYKNFNDISHLEYDAVFVLTPPSSHFDISKNAIKLKKHVFVEKPLCINPKESFALVSLAEKNSVYLSCGYVYRYHPIYHEIRNIVKNKKFGIVNSSKITMKGNVVSKDSKKSWRTNSKGGGCLYDYGCHAIDLSIFLFGVPNKSKCISKECLFIDKVVDKFTAELHGCIDNSKTLIQCDWSDNSVRKAGITLEINFDECSLYSDGQNIKISGIEEKSYSIKNLNTDVSYYLRGEEFQRQLDSFVSEVQSSAMNYSDAYEAAECDRIISNFHEAKV